MTRKHRTGDIDRQREIKRLDGDPVTPKEKGTQGKAKFAKDPPAENGNAKKAKLDFEHLDAVLTEPGWRAALQAEFQKPYWTDLQNSIQAEADSGATMYRFRF